MVKKIGIIGFSEGNGHPYSFSAIVNGYDDVSMAKSGWPGIYDYLRHKDITEFGIEGLQINAVWTQDIEESKKIASACKIEHVCSSLQDMASVVDAVIIARDDWTSHFELALYFLNKGKSVFIDKPLSLSIEELRVLRPFIKKGQLMSCAALRYARELDTYRFACKNESPKLINASIVCDWSRYGVHLLDGIFSGIEFNVESVYSSGDLPRSTILRCSDGKLISLNCIGTTEKTFSFNVYFEKNKINCEVEDNFTAFKRTLSTFRNMLSSGEPQINSELTIGIMKVLIAGELSRKENRPVLLREIDV